MPSSQAFIDRWNDLTEYTHKHYYKPDISGLRVILSTYLSHFYLTSPAVWLAVIGTPGTGKTEIGINPLDQFKGIVQPISSLTPASFLSGFGEDNGILSKLKNGNGIFTFPDLTTTFLSEDPITRGKVMGILRRIADGEYEKDVGSRGKKLSWKGKVTAIAACTPDIEDHWLMFRDMGERWLSIRWGIQDVTYEDMEAVHEYAKRHEGHEAEIKAGLRKRIKALIDNATGGAPGSPDSKELRAGSILLEKFRVNVKREHTGSGYAVTGRGNMQSVARTSKSVSMICKASTALRGSDVIEQEDIDLGMRVLLESIPTRRYHLLQVLINIFPESLRKEELAIALKLPRSSFDRLIEDMRHLELITVQESAEDNELMEIMGQHKAATGAFGPSKKSLDTKPGFVHQNTIYDIKRPKRDAIISINPMILKILRESNVLQK